MSIPASRESPRPLAGNSLEQWLSWQTGLHRASMELGLERCRQVAERMGALHPPSPVISVAGTNGKGSSVAMLESILHAAGHKVASYTSPHLVRYNERVKLQRQPVSDEELCEAFLAVERARGATALTFFEFGTLAALHIMCANSSKVDVCILEVGLGGRLDAVNIIDADLALITSIDLDHEQWLGRDRETIALEKGGIMRSGKPAVYADPKAVSSLRQQAKRIGARLSVYGEDFSCSGGNDGKWSWQGGGRVRDDLTLPHRYSHCQLYNASGVIMALDLLADRLQVTDAAIDRGLADSHMPCRFMVLPSGPEVILDVAHNVQAVEELATAIAGMPPRSGATHVLFGSLRDKNVGGMLQTMTPLADSWQCVSIRDPRGMSAESLASILRQHNVTVPVRCHDDVAEAVALLLQDCDSADRIIITGSFMVAGPASAHVSNGMSREVRHG